MAVQSSFKRINNYSKVLYKQCRRQSVLILILCAIQALLMIVHNVSFGRIIGGEADFFVIGRMFGLAAALAGVLIVPAVFRELYNRQFADVEFSLPLSASERFRSKLLVLVKHHFLPFMICQTLVLVLSVIQLSPDDAELILHAYLDSVVSLLFTDAVSLLCVSCCGSLAECIYTPLLSSAALSMLFPLCYRKFVMFTAGRMTVPMSGESFYLGYPMVNNFITSGEPFEVPDVIYSIPSWYDRPAEWIIPPVINILLCAAMIFLAYRIYRKRSGLNTGRPMVFKAFRIAFTALVTLTVIIYFFLNSFYLAIFVGLLAFLGISIMSKRAKVSLRELAIMMSGYLGCLAAVLITGFVSYVTGGFGYLKSAVPEVFDSDSTCLNVYMVTDKYEYTESLISRKQWEDPLKKTPDEIYFSESTVASFDDVKTVFDEVSSLDKRFSKSLGGNIADYWDLIMYEDNDYFSFYDNKRAPGTILAAAGMWDSDEREEIMINVDLDTLEDYRSKLEERGFLTEREDAL